MAAGHVQIAPDGSGKDVDADALTSTEGGTPTVYRQNVVISDPTTYANKAAVTAAGAQKVDGSGVTQPVSAVSLPLPTGASTDGTDITSPTAMPAGGAGIRGWLSAIWTKLNGTIGVTGTFWQATQPVSLATAPTTSIQGVVLAGSSTAVSAISPIPTTTNTAAGVGIPVATAGALTLVASGTFTGNPVVKFETSSDNGTTWYPIIGTRTDSGMAELTSTLVASTVRAWDFALPGVTHFRAYLTTVPASNTVTIGAYPGALLFDPTPLLFPQAGARTLTTFTAIATATVTTEAMLSLIPQRNGVAAAGATNFIVTTGKTFRLQSMAISVRSGAASMTWARVALRQLGIGAGGTVLITSPIIEVLETYSNGAVSGAGGTVVISLADGVDIPSGTSFGLSHISNLTTSLLTVTLKGYEY